jgi:TP901 family phage tail tape measure protein
MYAAWRVAVTISAANMAGPAFRSFAGQAGSANAGIAKLNASIMTVGTIAASAFAAAAAALTHFTTSGIDAAADFELAMVKLQIKTGATATEFKNYRDMAFGLSAKTAQSATTIAGEIGAAAQTGLTNKQIRDMMPQIAPAVDVVWALTGADPAKLTSEFIKLAHQTQAYDTKSLHEMVESTTKLLLTQPDSLDKVLTQSKYFAGLGKTAGMSTNEILDLLKMMGVTGFLQGRGGTAVTSTILSAVRSAAVTEHLTGAQNLALMSLGVLTPTGHQKFVDSKGHIQWTKMIEHLSKIADHTTDLSHYIATLGSAFGKGASPFLATLTSKPAREQMALIQEKTGHMGTVEEMQKALILHSFKNAMVLMQTNFTNVLIETFTPLMKALTPFILGLADALDHLRQFLTSNPVVAMGASLAIVFAGIATTLGAVATTAYVIFGPLISALTTLGGLITESAAFMRFAFMLGRLGPMLSALANPVGLAIVAIVALVAAFHYLPNLIGAVSKWWAGSRGHLMYTIGFGLGEVTKALIDGIGAMVMSVVSFSKNVIPSDLASIGNAFVSPNLWIANAAMNARIQAARHGARGGSTDKTSLFDYLRAGLGAGFGGQGYHDRDVQKLHDTSVAQSRGPHNNYVNVNVTQHVTLGSANNPHEVRKLASAVADVFNSSSNFSKNAAGGSMNSPFMVPSFARPH